MEAMTTLVRLMRRMNTAEEITAAPDSNRHHTYHGLDDNWTIDGNIMRVLFIRFF